MVFLGVDGCRAGWLAITLAPDNGWEVEIFNNFSQLWNRYSAATLILIDIPIGLREGNPEHGGIARQERRCDKEARKLLGPKRGPCVFRVPCRPAVYSSSYDDAIAQNEKLTGTRIFKATWNIVAKIREIDEFLSGNLEIKGSIREMHPELCFWSLNGCQPLRYSKTKQNGYLERYKLLKSVFPQSKAIIDYTLLNYLRTQVKKNDILDALVGAITAMMGSKNLSSIPMQSEKDLKGFPMEMVYFLFSLYQYD
jgi:predicted RNase H-like nuclease